MEKYFWACYNGYLGKVKECVEEGVDINGEQNGHPPFIVACYRGHQEIVEYLIGQNADVAISDKYGKTGLMYASSCGNTKIAELLLTQNSSLNFIGQQSFFGRMTALMYAAGNKHEDCVRLLLFYDPSDKHIMTKDYSGKTAIDYAKTGEIGDLLRSPAQLSMVGTKRAKPSAQN